MERLILALTLALTLTACGDDKKDAGSTSTKGDNVQRNTEPPVIEVPATAHVRDYACEEQREFTLDGRAESETVSWQGVRSFWKDSGYSLTLEEEEGLKVHVKSRNTPTGLNEVRREMEQTVHELVDGAWTSTFQRILRVVDTTGRIDRVKLNQVDDVDEPYFWELENIRVDAKTHREVSRHTQPSVRDGDGRSYTRITSTCTYTLR